ncbi:hypothetical protein HMPREF2976_03250 [Corynebacterium sp. HMSC077D10]|nr:30S ribosomal protein S13 domain protein [Corynebacterium sp. DNF00584]OFL79562.1 hypothetical protein HMPREF2748_09745 [Corynebacterium sp. HMSC077B05]OFP19874.1 hypothetical protein HMPREF2998_08840 [Corynebacterium sp. HMSC065A05]OFP65093.1 hypothetical protein HMPREF2976_03250 [Corynebacterium sp. HMSC077D10]
MLVRRWGAVRIRGSGAYPTGDGERRAAGVGGAPVHGGKAQENADTPRRGMRCGVEAKATAR